MDATTKLLMSYYGRDGIVRTVTYVAMLGAGRSPPPLAKKFGAVVAQLGAARTVMRLFDDVLMYKNVSAYGWGRKEDGLLLRSITVLNNLSSTLFFPVEHVAWLAEHKILPIESRKWWVAGIALWATSLTLGIVKNLLILKGIQKKMRLRGLKKLEGEVQEESDTEDTLSALRRQEIVCRLTILKNLSDLMNAVSWLPPGFLWGGKIPMFWNGVFGVISSLLGLRLIGLSQNQGTKKSA